MLFFHEVIKDDLVRMKMKCFYIGPKSEVCNMISEGGDSVALSLSRTQKVRRGYRRAVESPDVTPVNDDNHIIVASVSHGTVMQGDPLDSREISC